MNNNIKNTLIIWRIQIHDKLKPEFPIPHKDYCLNWNKLSAEEIAEINFAFEKNKLPLQTNPNNNSRLISAAFYTTREKRPEEIFLKYRNYFEEITENGFIEKNVPNKYKSFKCFSIPEYYEDENGKSIGMYKILQDVTHTETPVVLSDVKSILKLPKSGIMKKESWTQKHCNDIAHFLQIASALSRSSFNNYKPRMVFNGDKLVEKDLPNIESTVFTLTFLRQILEEDLLKTACSLYCRFVDNSIKIGWINNERECFYNFLKDLPGQVSIRKLNINNKNLIDAFMYGALILHSEKRVKDKNAIENYSKLYNLPIRDEAVWALYECLTTLIWRILNISGLIYSDFQHWLETENINKPETLWQQTMFSWKKY